MAMATAFPEYLTFWFIFTLVVHRMLVFCGDYSFSIFPCLYFYPLGLFGEGPAHRRDRLRELLAGRGTVNLSLSPVT